MPYFLAIDAGGTKTEFALADHAQELARVRTGSIQRQRVSEEIARQNLSEGLRRLSASTGISMQSVACTCIGTSGETVPLIDAFLRETLAESVGGELILLGDVEIALDSCFPGGRGVLVLAGTGSNVAGRAATGKILTAGGWGPNLADQGSGHFLGLEALRRGFLAIDKNDPARPTALLDLAMQHWRLPTLGTLIEFANATPAPNFSTFAPFVVSAAAKGDIIAQEILQQGGRDLADLACMVIARMRRLESQPEDFAPPAIAVAGSILCNVAPVREALTQSLRTRHPGIHVLETPADPVAGALWRARQGA
jgi:glucosamine kinase